MLLTNLLNESEGDDKTVYEVDCELNPREFKYAKASVIINQGTGKCIGLKAPLMRATKAKEADLKVSKDYVLKDYHTIQASGGYLKDKIRPYLNEDQRDVAIIEAKPYRKLANGFTVTFIHPKNYDEKDLSKLFKQESVYRDKEVEFFIDADADITTDVEGFPEYAILNKKLKNVTDAKARERGTYKFVVDPDIENEYYDNNSVVNGVAQKTWKEHLYILIFSTGYVRMGGTGTGSFGEDRLRVLHSPTGSSDLERKHNAWKAAVAEAKKRKWM